MKPVVRCERRGYVRYSHNRGLYNLNRGLNRGLNREGGTYVRALIRALIEREKRTRAQHVLPQAGSQAISKAAAAAAS
jgi:hypothetical protein